MNEKRQHIDLDEKDLEVDFNIDRLEDGSFVTDYFEFNLAKKGVPSLVYERGNLFMLMPAGCEFHKYSKEMDFELGLLTAGCLKVDGVEPRPAIQVDLLQAEGKPAASCNIPNATIKGIPWELAIFGVFPLILIYEGKKSVEISVAFQFVATLPHHDGPTKDTMKRLKLFS